ncbi:peptidase inhibitor family I36 protein [Actinomadura oligospora]|uniref:peptidase inhibitor family I36 protein n=1 Tax=Actinomadura oligospora TaxID=111804 RepID=UPI00047B8FF3|nr:peptidase inhibitor family I36 protein [Actinomadura oligospora]
MTHHRSQRFLKGAAALALGAALASTGATAAAHAAQNTHTPTQAVAGTGACTTGYFCLWYAADYDNLAMRFKPVQGPSHHPSDKITLSGYNATNQGQVVWQEVSGTGRCRGPHAIIRPYTRFRDIRKAGLPDGISCITHT